MQNKKVTIYEYNEKYFIGEEQAEAEVQHWLEKAKNDFFRDAEYIKELEYHLDNGSAVKSYFSIAFEVEYEKVTAWYEEELE